MVGEPPLLLGLSAWVAAKHALSSVRAGEIPRLDLPATGERLLMSISELLEARPAAPAAP
jgi:xanthine dehydrogenase large subunit